MAQLPQGSIWDPFTTLGFRSPIADCRCVGTAVSRGKARCRQRIKLEDRQTADAILRLMALSHPTAQPISDLLQTLAKLLVCKGRHKFESRQIKDKVKDFSQRISNVVAESREGDPLSSPNRELEILPAANQNASSIAEEQLSLLRSELSERDRVLEAVQRQLDEERQNSSSLRNSLDLVTGCLQETESQLNVSNELVQALQTSASSSISELQDDLAAKQAEREDAWASFQYLEASTSSRILEVQNDRAAKEIELQNTRASLHEHQVSSSSTINALQWWTNLVVSVSLKEKTKTFKPWKHP